MSRKKNTVEATPRAGETASQQLAACFQSIANSIRSKGVTGTMTPFEMSQKILAIPSGGGDSDKPIKFRDYDGTVLHSYTTNEVASMTELPTLPTKPGLTCQGWNWTLPQIKSYAAAYGKCEIGATYTTDDGKTRIKLTI